MCIRGESHTESFPKSLSQPGRWRTPVEGGLRQKFLDACRLVASKLDLKCQC
uniref:Uncharacterized protein n=1 Tax=Anguilla anguilla TaxID=7936 RepID=A0A0E9RVT3_ANGAN